MTRKPKKPPLDVPEGLRLERWSFDRDVVVPWARELARAGQLDPAIAERIVMWRGLGTRAVEHDGKWVYVARRHSDGALKIGMSADPMRRIKGLWCNGHYGFRLLAVMPGGERTEAILLGLLRPELLIPHANEWFRDSYITRAFAWFVVGARGDSGWLSDDSEQVEAA